MSRPRTLRLLVEGREIVAPIVGTGIDILHADTKPCRKCRVIGQYRGIYELTQKALWGDDLIYSVLECTNCKTRHTYVYSRSDLE